MLVIHTAFHQGVSLNVSVGIGMLTVRAIVSTKYKNKTRGLLGNFDGDPLNDFITPDGTIENTNMTERQIFTYGQLCKL